MKAPRKTEPWHPAPFTEREAYAVKAMHRGIASEDQQKLVFAWLMRAAGMTTDPFIPGQDDTRCYLLGRRSIGLQAADMVNWTKPADKPQGDG